LPAALFDGCRAAEINCDEPLRGLGPTTGMRRVEESTRMMQTPYDVLGVPRKAGDEAIRAAFCRAAKAYHPDLNSGDQAKEQKLKQVIAAYGVLKDAHQRAAYDQALADYEQYLRSRRRQRIQRFAAAPVAALVSGGVVALGVSLWFGPPHASGLASEEVAQRASQQVAALDDSDSTRPAASQAAASQAEVRTSFDMEWERTHSDPMPMWTSAVGNPNAPEGELLPGSIADVIAGRAQQRPARLREPLGARAVGEKSRAANVDALDERAASFVSARISRWSSAGTADLGAFVSAYADQVLYYGSLKSREAVLQDKRRFLERWPERRYELRPSSITAQCKAGVCSVSGLLDWRARSVARAASASGVAQFEYEVMVSDGAFRIISENSSVVRPRRAEPDQSQASISLFRRLY
jgi:curved DNA-binding protein CbpA